MEIIKRARIQEGALETADMWNHFLVHKRVEQSSNNSRISASGWLRKKATLHAENSTEYGQQWQPSDSWQRAEKWQREWESEFCILQLSLFSISGFFLEASVRKFKAPLSTPERVLLKEVGKGDIRVNDVGEGRLRLKTSKMLFQNNASRSCRNRRDL